MLAPGMKQNIAKNLTKEGGEKYRSVSIVWDFEKYLTYPRRGR
jgi:hypothetical protein